MGIGNDTITVLTLIAGGVVTLLARASFIIWHDRLSAPPWFTRALNLLPPRYCPRSCCPRCCFVVCREMS